MARNILIFTALGLILLVACREVDGVEPNRPPVAAITDPEEHPVGEQLWLDGSLSSDPDDDPLGYEWYLLQRPNGSQAHVQHADSVSALLTPDVAGTYRVRMVVWDKIATDADTMDVVAVAGNAPPVVNAGSDVQVDLGFQLPLTGTATDPDADPLTINWILLSKPAGSDATIFNANTLNALIVIDRPGTYQVRLSVSDGQYTVTDDKTITTNAVQVTTINPASGQHSISVVINGNNFSPVPAQNAVTFNGVAATVTAANYSSLTATVPVGAGTGTVNVTVNGQTSIGPVFNYLLTYVVSTVTQFDRPVFLASDSNGNLYISDIASHVIRRLTPGGQLTTIAGNGQQGYGDGTLLQAQFNGPAGIVVADDNTLFVVDNNNHCIRRIALNTGQVTTFAGFPQAGYIDATGGQAQFNLPIGLAKDANGNLYVADTGNGRVRRITPQAVVTTVAPNSPAFTGITSVAIDQNNTLYVAEATAHRISRITAQGVVSVFAGNQTSGFVNGTGTAARFNIPYGVACDANGNVFVADFSNHSIRRITPQAVVTTIAGDGVAGFVEGSNARFNQPTGVWVMPNGTLYVADYNNQRVRRIIPE